MADDTKDTTEDVDPTEDTAVEDSGPVADAGTGDELDTYMADLGIDADGVEAVKALGVTTVTDLAMVTEEDLASAGMPVITARKLAGVLGGGGEAEASVQDATSANTMSLLAAIPDEGSWLDMLKTGGVLKVDSSSMIAAIRASLATRVGMYDIPSLLAHKMEEFADSNDEPVDPMFFKLRKQITRKNYGDIFAAIDGLDGNFITEGRRKEFLTRVDQDMWPAVERFNRQLQSWLNDWMRGANNPMLLAAAMGGAAGAMPPGMMQAPPTDNLRSYAEAIADAINSTFKGVGVQVAAALAVEGNNIKETLEDPRLPGMLGAANRDQMIKELGVRVDATYPRLEANLTQFVLSAVEAGGSNVTAVEEANFFAQLAQLGNVIDWDRIGVIGIGAHKDGNDFSGIGDRNW